MFRDRSRLFAVWRRTISFAWPVSIQQAFNTLMRTTDIIVTGLFSPAAVAALGLADLYARLPHRLGQGLSGAAIALSSQDTGRGEDANRDEAITQALLLGFASGIPFIVFGALFGSEAIALLGAPSEVARLGGVYLAVIFSVAPARLVGQIGIASIQGTGDTRTPMVIETISNVINIVGSITLGLGVGPVPRLAILGVGLATAIARLFSFVAVLAVLHSDGTAAGIARPRSAVITRQLIDISIPKVLEGLSSTIVGFPFNALLLTFGTEVNAAYHIGNRMRQQFTGPVYRAFNTASSIVVGQGLGEGEPERARYEGWAVTALSGISLCIVGLAVFVGAEWLALIFTRDPLTLRYTIEFARVLAISGIFVGLFFTLSGGLRGAGETRIPFVGRLVGSFGFRLGFAFLASVTLGFGVAGVYAGIFLDHFCRFLIALYGYSRGDWAARAARMMADRNSH